jgi:hypothetical protein
VEKIVELKIAFAMSGGEDRAVGFGKAPLHPLNP